ncbi:hypothetical protein LIER_18208 [Lithospermum erythrorhizon]|uniref:Uncharacterized protein n=1 Tax=Lithospermum erythrorhizon TaxID=34254 RepID=A0AAV3QD34_LITER
MFSKIGSYLGNSLFADSATIDMEFGGRPHVIEEVRDGKPGKQETRRVWKPKGGIEVANSGKDGITKKVDGNRPPEVASFAVVVSVVNPFAILETEQNDVNDVRGSSSKVLQSGVDERLGRGTGQKLR